MAGLNRGQRGVEIGSLLAFLFGVPYVSHIGIGRSDEELIKGRIKN